MFPSNLVSVNTGPPSWMVAMTLSSVGQTGTMARKHVFSIYCGIRPLPDNKSNKFLLKYNIVQCKTKIKTIKFTTYWAASNFMQLLTSDFVLTRTEKKIFLFFSNYAIDMDIEHEQI